MCGSNRSSLKKGDRSAIVVEMGDTFRAGCDWAAGGGRKADGSEKPEIRCEQRRPSGSFQNELRVAARCRYDGNDFACGLTSPGGQLLRRLYNSGGWGGIRMAYSDIQQRDASENETTKSMPFAEEAAGTRCGCGSMPEKLEAWVDDKQMVDQEIKGRTLSLRHGEISLSKPLGVATFRTKAAFRDIESGIWRRQSSRQALGFGRPLGIIIYYAGVLLWQKNVHTSLPPARAAISYLRRGRLRRASALCSSCRRARPGSGPKFSVSS